MQGLSEFMGNWGFDFQKDAGSVVAIHSL